MMKVGAKDCKSQGTRTSAESQFPREEEEDEDRGENKEEEEDSKWGARVGQILQEKT